MTLFWNSGMCWVRWRTGKYLKRADLFLMHSINIPTSSSPCIIKLACRRDARMFLFIYSYSSSVYLICWGSSPGRKLHENRNSNWPGHCLLSGATTVTGTLIVNICGINEWRCMEAYHKRRSAFQPCQIIGRLECHRVGAHEILFL